LQVKHGELAALSQPAHNGQRVTSAAHANLEQSLARRRRENLP
jgi:hypothetical protein